MEKYCLYLYADILGYRELLREKGVYEVNSILKEYLSNINKIVMIEQNHIKSKQKLLKRAPKKWRYLGDYAVGEFNHFFAFDTIILCFKDISYPVLEQRLRDFLLLASTLYLLLWLKYNIKLRGVIKLTNEYIIEKDIVIIKEINECFKLEKDQNWAGILVDISDMDNRFWGTGPASEDECLYYEVPFKSRPPEKRFVLNPINKYTVSFIRDNSLSVLKSLKSLEKEASSRKLSQDVKEKLLHTTFFIKECIRRYNFSLKRERPFDTHLKKVDIVKLQLI